MKKNRRSSSAKDNEKVHIKRRNYEKELKKCKLVCVVNSTLLMERKISQKLNKFYLIRISQNFNPPPINIERTGLKKSNKAM